MTHPQPHHRARSSRLTATLTPAMCVLITAGCTSAQPEPTAAGQPPTPTATTAAAATFRSPAELQQWFTTTGGFTCTGEPTPIATCTHPPGTDTWQLSWSADNDGNRHQLESECTATASAAAKTTPAKAITDGATFSLRPTSGTPDINATLADLHTAGLTYARIITYCPTLRRPHKAQLGPAAWHPTGCFTAPLDTGIDPATPPATREQPGPYVVA